MTAALSGTDTGTVQQLTGPHVHTQSPAHAARLPPTLYLCELLWVEFSQVLCQWLDQLVHQGTVPHSKCGRLV